MREQDLGGGDMHGAPISKHLAALLRAVTNREGRPRYPNYEYPRYYPEDKLLMATDGSIMVLHEISLPFGNQLLDVAKGRGGWYLVPAGINPPPPDYTKAFPFGHGETVAQFELGAKKRTDRHTIIKLLVDHGLYVDYGYFEKLREMPALWDLHLPIPAVQEKERSETGFMRKAEPILLVSKDSKLTAVIMPLDIPRRE